MKNKRGLILEDLGKWIIAVVILVIFIIFFVFLKAKQISIVDFIKSIIRYWS